MDLPTKEPWLVRGEADTGASAEAVMLGDEPAADVWQAKRLDDLLIVFGLISLEISPERSSKRVG